MVKVKVKLKLYITGHTPRSDKATQNLKKISKEQFDDKFEIEVIDVLKNPQLAEEEKILATPTLIKKIPFPIRRIIGDLSNTEKVLLGLDLLPIVENEKEKKDEK